jgi:hypothetical protein
MASGMHTNMLARVCLLLAIGVIPFGIILFYAAAPAPGVARLLLTYGGIFVATVATIVTGHIARRQIRQRQERGNGLTIAGLAIGYVLLVFAVIALVIAQLWFVLTA